MLTRRSLFGLALLPVVPVPAKPATAAEIEIRRPLPPGIYWSSKDDEYWRKTGLKGTAIEFP